MALEHFVGVGAELVVNWRVRVVDQLDAVVDGVALETGLEGDLAGEKFHDGEERQGRMVEGVSQASQLSCDGWEHFSRLDVFFHLRLDGLGQFDVAKQGSFRLGFQLLVLELFQCLLADFRVLP